MTFGSDKSSRSGVSGKLKVGLAFNLFSTTLYTPPGLGLRLARGAVSGRLRYFGENQGALQALMPPIRVSPNPLRCNVVVLLSHSGDAENFHMELSMGFIRCLWGLILAPLGAKDCL